MFFIEKANKKRKKFHFIHFFYQFLENVYSEGLIFLFFLVKDVNLRRKNVQLFHLIILNLMKRSLLTLAVLLSMASVGQAQKLVPDTQKFPAQALKATYNSCDVSFIAPIDRVSGFEADAPRELKAAPVRKAHLPLLGATASTDTVSYFAVAQSYHSNYQFKPEGGDIFGYNIGLCIDGNTATFTNLFNMLASSTEWSKSYDYPVEGVYNAEAGTITIPTTTAGIPCGSYSSGYYEAMLVAGEVSSNGVMTPAEELVFNLTYDEAGNVATVTAASSFAARYTYGNIVVYKSFTANIPQEGVSNVMTFTESVDFGEAFVGTANTASFMLINNGGADADFVIELEAEDDAFTCSVDGGTVPALGTLNLDFSFLAEKAGSYEGIVTITYETGSGEASLVVDLAGSAIDYPDYSGAVESGDFTFTTIYGLPFEPVTLEDGTQAAMSGCHGQYGSSWLNMAFTVPEGKIATVAWKGMSYNVSSWYCSAGYFIDTLNGAAYSNNGDGVDMSGSYEFAPGEHFIRYQYDCNRYTGLEDNRMYVYGITYTESTLNADSAAIITPVVALGNGVLPMGGSVTKNGTIVLKNLGANNLTVTNVTSDNADFTCDLSGLTPVATMQQLNIPVALEAKNDGDHKANITIETNAGTFTAEVTAHIIPMPDFNSLVVEGAEYITNWSMNEEQPFVIVDGHARNLNAGDNSVYSTAWFKMDLTIPEGKLAYVSWKGVCAGRPVVEGSYDHYYSSYLNVEMSHPMVSGTKSYWETTDASSDGFANDEYWADYLACVPGNHYYKWGWYHNGDGSAPEGDFVEIWDIQIHVIDFEEYNVELLTEEANFEPTFVGYNRYTTTTVRLRNIGSAPLQILGYAEGSAPFYGIDNTFPTQFNKTVDLTLWFYPTEPGEYNGEITIQTSAGDVVVPCHGVARDAAAEGIILAGDFEDDAYGWSAVDLDQDGETWDLGSNLWGDRPEYCHGGSQCLASVSLSNWLGAVEPDNWTLSPIISLPEDVTTTLSYYVAAFSPKSWLEHYSLYVVEYSELEGLDVATVAAEVEPIISETMTEEAGQMDGWQYREFSLADYAGKDVVLCFRHHDCNGQYLFRLDDVFVTMDQLPVGVSAISDNAKQQVEVYAVDGRKLNAATEGLNIVRTRQADGSVKAVKVMK